MLSYPLPQEALVADLDYGNGLGREVLSIPAREGASVGAYGKSFG